LVIAWPELQKLALRARNETGGVQKEMF